MLNIMPYEPSRSLAAKIARRVIQWRTAAPIDVRPTRPILSLTFDDCPKTAATVGASILDSFNVQGCFYIATGLLGLHTPVGRMADPRDIQALSDHGHEIAAHTHSHIDCAQTDIDDVLRDVDKNLSELDELTRGKKVESFAFPFGETSFAVKSRLAEQFSNVRGVLPGHNRGLIDRAQLRALEVDGCEQSVDRVIQALNTSLHIPEWTILFTHDVSDSPSAFGMTPEQLVRVVEYAKSNGIEILPPAQVMTKLDLTP